MSDQTPVASHRRRLPRTRGVAGGMLLIVLGAWGGLAAFVGPYYNFGFTPDDQWHWTAARGWLEVLPGAITLIGGVLLVVSASRATTVTGAVLGIVGGAWFVVGTPLAGPLRLGSPGRPLGTAETQRAMETLALFTGLGALILIVAAATFGRLSVVTVRDADAAARREQQAAEPVPSDPVPSEPTEPVPSEPTEPVPSEPTEPVPSESTEPAPSEPTEPAPPEQSEPDYRTVPLYPAPDSAGSHAEALPPGAAQDPPVGQEHESR